VGAQRREINVGITAQIKVNAGLIASQIDRLMHDGVRVVLMWLPMHQGLEAAPAFASTRTLTDRLFPPSKYEWFTLPDSGSHHTSDTPMSGVRVSRLLLETISSVAGPRQVGLDPPVSRH